MMVMAVNGEWLFLEIGGPCYGCPRNNSIKIRVYMKALLLVVGTSHTLLGGCEVIMYDTIYGIWAHNKDNQ